jgi:hypothetical protein
LGPEGITIKDAAVMLYNKAGFNRIQQPTVLFFPDKLFSFLVNVAESHKNLLLSFYSNIFASAFKFTAL